MSMHCFIIIALLYVILTVPYASECLLISNQNATPATKIIPWLTLLLSTQGPWQKCCGVKSMIFVFQM